MPGGTVFEAASRIQTMPPYGWERWWRMGGEGKTRRRNRSGAPIRRQVEVVVVNDPELRRRQLRAIRKFLITLASRVGEKRATFRPATRSRVAGRLPLWGAACGPCEVAPARTRIVARVRFACVSDIGDRGDDRFGLPRRLEHPRIRKVEDYGGEWYGHWMRITSPEELADELLGWLRESYRQMGLQERLAER